MPAGHPEINKVSPSLSVALQPGKARPLRPAGPGRGRRRGAGVGRLQLPADRLRCPCCQVPRAAWFRKSSQGTQQHQGPDGDPNQRPDTLLMLLRLLFEPV